MLCPGTCGKWQEAVGTCVPCPRAQRVQTRHSVFGAMSWEHITVCSGRRWCPAPAPSCLRDTVRGHDTVMGRHLCDSLLRWRSERPGGHRQAGLEHSGQVLRTPAGAASPTPLPAATTTPFLTPAPAHPGCSVCPSSVPYCSQWTGPPRVSWLIPDLGWLGS